MLGTVVPGLGTASAQAGTVTPAAWGECPADQLTDIPAAERPQYSCAVQQVPVDHSRPRGESIGIAMMRHRATDPAKKIGSLFVNPGGPSVSGLIWSLYATYMLAPEVLEKFDVVGFDPRGVGRSAPLRCFRTQEEADAVNVGWSSLPITEDEIASTLRQSKAYTDYCGINGGPLLNHMSTEAVARDLDVLREAVGDKQLTYVGLSYGTLIGATYANIFPGKSRALVLDGNVDPRLRLTNGTEYDRERAQGLEISLDAMLKRCDAAGVAKCAFAGDARRKFDDLRESLRKAPTTLADGRKVTLADLVDRTASYLYSPSRFATLTQWLQSIHVAQHPAAARAFGVQPVVDLPPLDNRGGRADVRVLLLPESPYASDDSFFAINCTDMPFPRTTRDWEGTAARWEKESPTFGRGMAATELMTCPTWPAHDPDRWIDPWHRKTPNPVVVVGNYYDPATRYVFAQRMAKELGNARLISVDALGHGILGYSRGVDAAVGRYLVDLTAPADGSVFQPNERPFA